MTRTLFRRRARTTGIALTGALLVALLAGCTAIPTTGPVKTGLTDLRQADQVVQYNPVGPERGSSREDIVRGFVQAATSSAEDYSVAREYLTTAYSEQWDPYSGVLVDDGSRPYRATDDGGGVLSIAAVAKVDADGLLLPVEPEPTTDMRFEFERVEGEWRIASAPNGIILDRTVFTTIWSAHDILFVGAGGYLVPETRWFLSRTAIATEVVGALLDGPGERMSATLHSGIPAGTTLVSGAVPVIDGRAQVDLSGELLQATPSALAEVFDQLAGSLQGIAGVTGFDLFVEGSPVDNDAASEQPDPPTAADVANPAVLMNSVFGTLVSGELRAFPAFGTRVVDLAPNAITLSRDETVAAVRNAEGVSRVDAEGVALVDGRQGQLEPSIDMLGYLWSVQPSDPSQIMVTSPDGVSTPVSSAWITGRAPVSVRLSPDGSRIAALVANGEDSLVVVAGVIRDEAGRPTQTTDGADPQLWVSGAPIDFDWIDQSRFVTLTGTGGGAKVTIGGPGIFATEKGTVPGGTQLSGGGITSQLRVLGSDGDLFASQGSGWQRSDYDIDVLAKRD